MNGSWRASLGILLLAVLGLGSPLRGHAASTITTESVYVVGAGPVFGFVGASSLALDASGTPHITFVDDINQLFMYGIKSGGSWTFESIAPNGFDPIFGDTNEFTTIAIDPAGNPHIAFWDPVPNLLKYASKSGGVWTIETADPVPNNGRAASLAIDASGTPHISYYDQTNEVVKYATKSGGAWIDETVDASGIEQPEPQGLALDPLGNPSIVYLDFNTGSAKYAVKSGGTWVTEFVPGTTVGHGNAVPSSVAIDASGNPHIAYVNILTGSLFHTVKSGGSWLTEAVDPSARSLFPSIRISSSGAPCISYYDRAVGTRNLKYATKSGGVWTNQVIDAPGDVGRRSSLALDASDNPHITYSDATNLAVKYASVESSGGTISGTVLADCPAPGTPAMGVTLDAFIVGSGMPAGTAVTDAGGRYRFDLLAAGDYDVVIVTPLGYEATPQDQIVTVADSQTSTLDFALHCATPSGDVRAIGFWKHQVAVATTGKGSAEVDATTLCGYLDLVAAHFNSNQVNPVVVYVPPASGDCDDKLTVAANLLNLQGSVAMRDRARQQLLALLLNVASGRLGTMSAISVDGATVSQAITYCDHLIDSPSGDYERAKSIADTINNGATVAAGTIPLSTAQIAYRRGLSLRSFKVTPNPGPGARTFSFTMAQAGFARVAVYDVSGRLVTKVADGPISAGPHSVSWDGKTSRGGRMGGGVYFARLETAEGSRTLKVIQQGR